jgi:hypothetical protein
MDDNIFTIYKKDGDKTIIKMNFTEEAYQQFMQRLQEFGYDIQDGNRTFQEFIFDCIYGRFPKSEQHC